MWILIADRGLASSHRGVRPLLTHCPPAHPGVSAGAGPRASAVRFPTKRSLPWQERLLHQDRYSISREESTYCQCPHSLLSPGAGRQSCQRQRRSKHRCTLTRAAATALAPPPALRTRVGGGGGARNCRLARGAGRCHLPGASRRESA